jgi:glutamyl-tRNA synthetase/glutamyl-Q tRNA(Asp) synthetase
VRAREGEAPRLDPPAAAWTTRFAPAPTGWLHLGHAANAVWVWGLARARGGRVLVRVEDHDRVRSSAAYERALLEDLDWLGLAPDEPPTRQSERGELYARALERLRAEGRVYVCACSRRDLLAAAQAGAAAGVEPRYPGTCRERALAPGASPIRRVRLEPATVEFEDLRLGPRRQRPSEQCGDLAARDRDGNWTYQFAATVDDLEQEIDLVIRGEDLLESTGRQIQLGALLGRDRPARYLHHPLIRRQDGAKLSKSGRDTGLRELRAAGWTPARVLGAAAYAVGLIAAPRPLPVDELPGLFADE